MNNLCAAQIKAVEEAFDIVFPKTRTSRRVLGFGVESGVPAQVRLKRHAGNDGWLVGVGGWSLAIAISQVHCEAGGWRADGLGVMAVGPRGLYCTLCM